MTILAATGTSSIWSRLIESLDQSMELGWPFLVLLGGVFLLGLALLYAARRKRMALNRALAHLQDLNFDNGNLEDDDWLPKGYFREQWHEFVEGFVHIDGKAYNTLSADSFFKDDGALNDVHFRSFHYPVLRTLASIATGIGILGTFLGIAIGLGALAHDVGSGKQDQPSAAAAKVASPSGKTVESGKNSIVKNLPNVIGALSSAFWTSIFGVLLALFISIFGHVQEARLLAVVDQFREALDRRVTRLTPDKVIEPLSVALQRVGANTAESNKQLQELRDESKQSKDYLQMLANDMADAIGDSFSSALNDVLAPQLAALTDLVRGQVEQASVNSVEQARRFTDEMVSQVSGALQQSLTEMGTRVETASSNMVNASASLQGIVESAKNAVAESTGSVSRGHDMLEAARAQNEETTRSLQALGQATNALEQILAGSASHQKDLAALQTNQQQIQNQGAEQTQEMVRSLTGVAGRVEAATKQLGEGVSVLTQHVAAMSGDVSALSQNTTTAGATMREAASKLHERAEAEARLMQRYAEANASFSQAFSAVNPALLAMKTTADAVTKLAEEMPEERQKLFEMLNQVKQAHSALKDVSLVLTQGYERVEGLLRSAAQDVRGVVDGTATWAQHATSSVEQFGEQIGASLQRTLQDYDQSLAAGVKNLGAAMKELEDLAEEIASAARPRRGN